MCTSYVSLNTLKQKKTNLTTDTKRFSIKKKYEKERNYNERKSYILCIIYMLLLYNNMMHLCFSWYINK